MIRIRYPKNFDESNQKSIQNYFDMCSIDLFRFKGILKKNINISRWNALTSTLKDNNIIDITFIRNINAINIADQFITQLRCTYDYGNKYCYYFIPDTIRCVGTNTSLSFVIKLIEYGNDIIPPFNWIRHSYTKFVDYVNGRL